MAFDGKPKLSLIKGDEKLRILFLFASLSRDSLAKVIS
jgi:hypothetical protein